MKSKLKSISGIFNMQLYMTWMKATFVMIVLGGILLFRMREECERYAQLIKDKLIDTPIYFHDILLDIEWGRTFLTSLIFIIIIISLIPLWQGRNGFYTTLRLPIRAREYVTVQWSHCFLWLFFHWVANLGILYLLYEMYSEMISVDFSGTPNLILGIVRNKTTMRWYPLIAMERMIPWLIQMLLLAFTPIYASTCIQTGHKWGMIIVVIHLIGTISVWSSNTGIAGMILWLIVSAHLTVWMGYLMKGYLTVEKGL